MRDDKDIIAIFKDPFEFGGFLQEYRLKRGLNLSQLAIKAGVSITCLRFWENRQRMPSISSMYIVMRRLGVNKVIFEFGGANEEADH